MANRKVIKRYLRVYLLGTLVVSAICTMFSTLLRCCKFKPAPLEVSTSTLYALKNRNSPILDLLHNC